MLHLEEPTSIEYSQAEIVVMTAIFDLRYERTNLRLVRPYKKVTPKDAEVPKKSQVTTKVQIEAPRTSTPGSG